jgi:hypothetical protein
MDIEPCIGREAIGDDSNGVLFPLDAVLLFVEIPLPMIIARERSL